MKSDLPFQLRTGLFVFQRMKMKAILFSMILIMMALFCHAQPSGPELLWSRSYQNAVRNTAINLLPSEDGGYLVSGNNWNQTSLDLFLMRLDSRGNQRSLHRYGSSEGYIYGGFICRTSDGIIMAGYNNGITMVRLTDNDSLLWLRQIDIGMWQPRLESMFATSDGNYILVSERATNSVIVKVSADGDTLWSRHFSDFWNRLLSGCCTSNGGYALTGSIESNPTYVPIIKTDSVGLIESIHTYRIPWGSGCEIISLYDGGFAVIGEKTDSTGNRNEFVLRTNSSGDSLWSHIWDRARNDFGYKILQTPDNGLALLGIVEDPHARGWDYTLTRLDSIGNELWQSLFFFGTDWIYPPSFMLTDSNHYVIWGNSDLETTILIETASDPVLSVKERENAPYMPANLELTAFPNPFNSLTFLNFFVSKPSKIRMSLYDLLGREIMVLVNREFSVGSQRLILDGRTLVSGTYYCYLKTRNEHSAIKLVLLR
jgi:hypothetical protein